MSFPVCATPERIANTELVTVRPFCTEVGVTNAVSMRDCCGRALHLGFRLVVLKRNYFGSERASRLSNLLVQRSVSPICPIAMTSLLLCNRQTRCAASLHTGVYIVAVPTQHVDINGSQMSRQVYFNN